MVQAALREIAELVFSGLTPEEAKRRVAKKYHLPKIPSNYEILEAVPKKLRSKLRPLLKKRPRRTLSGVTPVAIMVKPKGSCRHSCIYCPTSAIAPKSYTGYEPAALRARSCSFDPYLQVKARLKQYEQNAHPTEKCELIVMGGTFLEMEEAYRTWFIKRAYDAFNESESSGLEEAKMKNETARHRVVALTIETRPDVCGKREIEEMLRYGTTRVEIGVQTLDDEILALVKRGHGTKETIKATSLLKDSCFKVCYHIMLGLPGSTPEKDLETVKKLFSSPAYRPDMLKIYPTLVLKGTPLYQMYLQGAYKPYDESTLIDLIARIYALIPPYVRVMRIMRDIPANLIDIGAKKSNLRELVEQQLKGKKIKEIRYREVLDSAKNEKLNLEEMWYNASGGKECFLSYVGEESKKLYAFLRLRFPHQPFRPEIDEQTCLIRELRTYGQELPVHEKAQASSAQHRGLGTALLKRAEELAKEHGSKKVIVNSGVGVKMYYIKRGYRREGPYMSKLLR